MAALFDFPSLLMTVLKNIYIYYLFFVCLNDGTWEARLCIENLESPNEQQNMSICVPLIHVYYLIQPTPRAQIFPVNFWIKFIEAKCAERRTQR